MLNDAPFLAGHSTEMLKMTESYTIIGIHNHPGSSVPSIGDIMAAEQRKYKYGLIACHNGDIFKYKIVGNVDKENADFYLELINKLIYNNRDTINKKKLEDLLEKLKVFGVEMEVFLHDNI